MFTRILRIYTALLIGSCVTVFVTPALCLKPFSQADVEALIANRSLGVERDRVNVDRLQTLLNQLAINLAQMQQQELVSYFNHILGVDLGARDPYQFAREKSRANLNRLTFGQGEIQNTFEYKIALRVVEGSVKRFQHNMVDPPETMKNTPLWLSSKQLQEQGLYGGLQSSSDFNKQFLGTQNWIFFHVNRRNDKTYGSNEIFLDGKYAAEHGFIFPFVMYQQELAAAGNYMDERAGQRLRDLFENVYIKTRAGIAAIERDIGHPLTEPQRISLLVDGVWRDDLKPHEFVTKHIDIYQEFRKSLADYMFTVDDYKSLVATKMAAHLSALRRQNKVKYLKEIAILGGSSLTSSNIEYVERLTAKLMRDARLPERFELRVPVGIPSEHLGFGNGPCESFFDPKQNP